MKYISEKEAKPIVEAAAERMRCGDYKSASIIAKRLMEHLKGRKRLPKWAASVRDMLSLMLWVLEDLV